MGQPIEVAIVDDLPVFRDAIRGLLQRCPDLHVVAEAGDGLSAIAMFDKVKPEVVLMDINMPGMNGLDATSVIISRFPDTRVIILSMYSDAITAASSCHAGACYHLSKDCSPKEILAAIRGQPS